LLSQPETALRIVHSVIDAVGATRPVTVKMRRGMDDSAAAEGNFFEILDGALMAGVAAVTVHGRTVQQRYVGPSRWEFLSRVSVTWAMRRSWEAAISSPPWTVCG
jgi:tRNA-dihydrouridine synthase